MSRVPSAGMFNLGQKGSSSNVLHITFCMLIDATEPRESFCAGKEMEGERGRDGRREGVAENRFWYICFNGLRFAPVFRVNSSMFAKWKLNQHVLVWEFSPVLQDEHLVLSSTEEL